ncbi:CAP domain-containing protein [Streptomyces sp. ISL-98]|nr:CAP domain-containing protein [Streptomyces sp. ISL-98]
MRKAQQMGRHRQKRAAPVRTGLLGVSAAVALGAVAVTSGLLPGSDNYSLGGGGSADRVQAGGSAGFDTQGGNSAEPTDRASDPAADRSGRTQSPSPAPGKPSAKPSAEPSAKPSERETVADSETDKPAEAEKSTRPEHTRPTQAQKPPSNGNGTGDSDNSGAESSAEARVLTLVNQERSKAGCSPVRADGPLAALAEAFSEDMDARNFFDHTDPDGASPWDRAEKAGVSGLGGENIARGQADAQSVMDAWMNSDGHRANILNCEYKTLGVGVHMASGGPWWTQDFGF